MNKEEFKQKINYVLLYLDDEFDNGFSIKRCESIIDKYHSSLEKYCDTCNSNQKVIKRKNDIFCGNCGVKFKNKPIS